MKRIIMVLVVGAAVSGSLLLVPAEVKSATCPPDSVMSGSTCMDKYEASVWRIPPTNPAGGSNALLIKGVRLGVATVASLTAAGATQLGKLSDTEYAPCNGRDGSLCTDIYAVSLRGVLPSTWITWFQAQQACKNARKRLPSNAEWQAAVAGTQDPGPDNGTSDCNTNSAFAVVATGSRIKCVSSDGAFDMVGNLTEWVADWVPRSSRCGHWGDVMGDTQCLAGVATTDAIGGDDGPGALLRGGYFGDGVHAGPLAVDGRAEPSGFGINTGFRCAR